MFGKDRDDPRAARMQAELSGMLDTKRGLTIFYTSVLGYDIETAMPKIKAECELRGIDFDAVAPPPGTEKTEKPGWMDKASNVITKIEVLAEKHPTITEMAKPLIGAVLTGAVTTITGVLTGNKIAQENQENEVIEAPIEIVKLQPENR